jgi:hypothetical protein
MVYFGHIFAGVLLEELAENIDLSIKNENFASHPKAYF